MSEESLSQSDVAVVIVVAEAGVAVARGLTPITAVTDVTAEFAFVREDHDTSRLPAVAATRRAGRKFDASAAGLSPTGALCTGVSEPSLKLRSTMSPSGWGRVSFHTML